MSIKGELVDEKCIVHNVDEEEHTRNYMADCHLSSACKNSFDKETIHNYGEKHKNGKKDDPNKARIIMLIALAADNSFI